MYIPFDIRKFKSVESYTNLSILFGKNFMKQKVELVIINIIKVYFDFCRLFILEDNELDNTNFVDVLSEMEDIDETEEMAIAFREVEYEEVEIDY